MLSVAISKLKENQNYGHFGAKVRYSCVVFFSSQTWSLDSAYLYLSDSFFASGIEFSLRLKGQSHEIKVWFCLAQWTGKILLIFPQNGCSSLYKRFHA